MLNKKERIFLRSKAQTLQDLVFIGKEGLTDNVIKQIEDNLFAHELIKVKVQNTCEEDKFDLAEEVAKITNCDIVTIIGTKIVLYKLSDKKNIKHILESI